MTEDEYRAAHPERLRVYDIGMDDYRDVTQADVDQMMRKINELWRLYAGEISDGGRHATVGILT